MKGSVRKRKNNAWSYRIDLGYVGGKRKQIEKGSFKTERAATKAIRCGTCIRTCPTGAVCFRYGFGDSKDKTKTAEMPQKNNDNKEK